MVTQYREEPERFQLAEAGAEIGRVLLSSLAHTGMVWAPTPPFLPLTRSPKNLRPDTAPAEVTPATARPGRLRLLLQRFAG
jgi:hypothetical protein